MDQLSCDSPNPLSGATAQAHTPFPSQALRDCVWGFTSADPVADVSGGALFWPAAGDALGCHMGYFIWLWQSCISLSQASSR